MAQDDVVSSLDLMLGIDDFFAVQEFAITENISQLFAANIVFAHQDPALDFEQIVGRVARFAIETDEDLMPTRAWYGIVSSCEQLAAQEDGLSMYEVTIVPRLWLLTERRNYRIFQQMSDLDVVLSLLREWGISFELRMSPAKHPTRKLRVQYAETDYNFVSRLLQESGISFFFDSAAPGSKLILTNQPELGARRKRPLPFRSGSFDAEGEYATGVRTRRKLRPAKYVMADHDYRKPADYRLLASAHQTATEVEEQLERFHYVPGAFLFGGNSGEDTPAADDRGKTRTDEKQANRIVNQRLDAQRGNALTFGFEVNVVDVATGTTVCLLDHPRPELGADHPLLIVGAIFQGTAEGEWTLRVDAVSAERHFCPALTLSKPRALGVESATVVGPKGEAIHTDEFGRVRVHFHWTA
jgi:type VI secretion system secreted protein VgrG